MAAPKLRFKEFVNEICYKELGSLITLMQSGLSRQLKDEDIGLPVLRSNNIQDFRVDYQDIKYWYKNDPQGADTKNYLLKHNDLLVNFINSMAQIGKSAIYNGELGRNAIITTNLMRLQFNNLVIPKFISYYFQTKQYEDYIQSITKPAVNQASFTTKEFQKLKVPYFSIEEQTKIASFLSNVDEKISQLTQKHALLNQYKQGMMQKLFSQQIRFKADDGSEFGEWEEKTLGSLGVFKSGQGFPEKYQGGKTGVPFFKVSDMNTYGNEKRMVVANNYVDADSILEMKVKVILDESIIFAKVGAAVFLERKRLATNFLIDNNMMAFTPDPKLNINFIKQFLDTIKFSNFVQVGALPSYNAGDLAIIPIHIPCVVEQTKIANFLSAIDQKIDVVAQQIEQTKQWKKGLLQQMFV